MYHCFKYFIQAEDYPEDYEEEEVDDFEEGDMEAGDFEVAEDDPLDEEEEMQDDLEYEVNCAFSLHEISVFFQKASLLHHVYLFVVFAFSL